MENNTYQVKNFKEAVEGNSYPGRGIIVGETPDNKKAVIAYFIMGRSENSRNRVFVKKNGAVFTEPFEMDKLEDPSLIIYAPVRTFENHLVVTNGNQTDTVCDGFVNKTGNFFESLRTRCFEPDAPNLTPRISAEVEFGDKADFIYRMSILKSADAEGTACNRYGYEYEPIAGLGHFIHTYECNGNPLPTFVGEPRRVEIPQDIDAFTDEIWTSLDEDNKISLYVRYTDLVNGDTEDRLINKHTR